MFAEVSTCFPITKKKTKVTYHFRTVVAWIENPDMNPLGPAVISANRKPYGDYLRLYCQTQ